MSTATPDNEFATPTGVLWDDPEPGQTWTVSLIGITIFAALTIAISVIYFRTEQAEVNAKVIEPEYLALKDLRAAQVLHQGLGGPAHRDAPAGARQVLHVDEDRGAQAAREAQHHRHQPMAREVGR
ncbi:MAG: hypothetical protein ACKOQW_08210, partial [Phycisphaerales bacterium]